MIDRHSKTPVYQAFGLNISCDLSSAPLFGLTPVYDVIPDVVMRVGEVPEEMDELIYQDQFISYKHGSLLLKIKGIARYLISNTKEITIDIAPEAQDGDVATFAFGSAMGTLLYQRGILALHGSAVRLPKGAVIFSGQQGAGKSTTAAALSARGWEFLSDDICAIHLQNNKAILYPGLFRAKLTKESYTSVLNISPDNPPISPVQGKYGVTFPSSRQPAPVDTICLLETTTGSPYIETVKGSERLTALLKHNYRSLIHQLVENPAHQFIQHTTLSSQATILRVFRPLDFSKIGEFLQLLENTLLT